MPRIFINYRREDSIAYAGRIYDRLVSQFGVANVFMDIDTLAPGADFVEVLQQRIETCDAFLVVIGKNWLAAKDDQGRSRLSNPKDFVALEIAAALGRQAVRTIPVLVGGASMPRATDLPKKLSALTRRQAMLLPDIGFQAAIGQLIESIELDERERIERQRAGAERKSREAEEARQKAEAERAWEEAQQKAEAEKASEIPEEWESRESQRRALEPQEARTKTRIRLRRTLWIAVSAVVILVGIYSIFSPGKTELLTLSGHSGEVLSVAWSPDGKRLATDSRDGTSKVWDTQTGKEFLTLSHSKPVNSVAWRPDGKRLATGSDDDTVRIWDAETGKELLTLSYEGYDFERVAWSPDGRRLATSSVGYGTIVWDAEKRLELLTLKGGGMFMSVAWSPDGRRLATTDEKTAKVWDAEKGQEQ